MFKHFFLFSLIVFACSAAFSQDSTLQKILSAKDDSFKVKKLIDYARTVANNDNSKEETIYKSALKISQDIGYWNGIGTSWLNLGVIDQQGGKYEAGIQKCRIALVYFKKINKVRSIGVCITNIGSCHELTGQRDSAMIYYVEAAKVFEGGSLYTELAHVYNNIGLLHSNNKDYRKGLEYAEKAINIAREHKDTAVLLLALLEKSRDFHLLKEYANALPPAHEALAFANALQINYYLAEAYNTLSRVQLDVDKSDSAIINATKSMKYADESGFFNSYLSAALHLSKGYDKQARHSERLGLLKMLLKKCEDAGTLLLLDDIYEQLADVSYKMNDYRAAYNYHTKFTLYKDSIFSEQNTKTLTELEIKYQTAQKEKAITQKNLDMAKKEVQLQKSQQMNVYGIASTMVALLAALLVFLHFKNKRKLDQKQLQTIRQEKEIHLLQAMMQGEEKERSRIAKDLHDGVAGMLAAVKMHFNSIALHVGGVLQTEGYQQGLNLLDEASQEVRKTSHNLMPEVLLQHGLDEAIRRYCNNVTNSSKLLVQYDSIGELERFVDSFELSVYRIVQELLNNIVKHSKASEAIVQITYQSQLLSITIEDNGIGFSKEGPQKDGMGLKSLQSRVKAMNGKIEFDSTAGQGLNAYLEFETVGLEKKPELTVA